MTGSIGSSCVIGQRELSVALSSTSASSFLNLMAVLRRGLERRAEAGAFRFRGAMLGLSPRKDCAKYGSVSARKSISSAPRGRFHRLERSPREGDVDGSWMTPSSPAPWWQLLYGVCGFALRRLASTPGVVLPIPARAKEKLARSGRPRTSSNPIVHALVVGLRGVWRVRAARRAD